MRKLLLSLAFLAAFCGNADAASRFWNPYSVTGAVAGTGGVCRLTISPAITGSGLLAGNAVSVTGIVGATECNTSTTISAVVDSTHIELAGTTFNLVYASGGCVGGGNITTTNTSNWAASSTATCGSGGQTVPGSADTITLDANSLSGTIVLNFGGTWTIQSWTMGAFTGTFDNSVNNNNVTVTNASGTTLNWSGSGVRTYKLGTATYSISGAGASFSTLTTTNLTYSGNTGATIAFTGVGTSQRAFSGGSVSHGTVTINSITGGGNFIFNGANTIQNLSVTGPNYIIIQNGVTLTIASAFTLTGTAAGVIGISSPSIGSTTTIAAQAGSTGTWLALRDVIVTGNTMSATNSFDLGNNTNITITPPQAVGAGGGSLIGG